MANMIPISTVVVGSGGASSIEFAGIPQTYTDLVLKLSARGTRSATECEVRITINSSSTSYSNRAIQGNGSSASSFTYSTTFYYNGEVSASTATSSTFGSAEIYFPNYTSSNYKSISSDTVSENNATSAFITMVAGLWSNTSPIASISIVPSFNNWAQYSSATLYGIRKY